MGGPRRSAATAPAAFSRAAGTLSGTGKLHRRNLLRACGAAAEAARAAESAAAAAAPPRALDPVVGFAAQGGTTLDAARTLALYTELGVPLDRAIGLLLAGTVGEAERGLAALVMDPERDSVLLGEIIVAASGGAVVAAGGEAAGAAGGFTLSTGATGFVGRSVLAELLGQGRQVGRACTQYIHMYTYACTHAHTVHLHTSKPTSKPARSCTQAKPDPGAHADSARNSTLHTGTSPLARQPAVTRDPRTHPHDVTRTRTCEITHEYAITLFPGVCPSHLAATRPTPSPPVVQVVSLVRTRDPSAARRRLQAALASARRWDPAWWPHLHVECGSLGPPLPPPQDP